MTIVVVLLVLDLGLFNKKDHAIGLKESLMLSAGYIAVGLIFGVWVFYRQGGDSAMDYYTAYILEKTLSLDNLFVMSVIFTAFAIPKEYQHRVLIWGIIGVIVLRGGMILMGAALIHHFAWVLYIFAAILIVTGIKMMFIKESEDHANFDEKPLIKFLKTHFRFTPAISGKKFFVKVPPADGGKAVWVATPLFLALIVIELTDVMFAFDSVPAALAVTTDVYIVFTSNIFAILGLRALYFAMDQVLSRLEYLKYSLAAVLIFIGLKVFYNGFSHYLHMPHISPAVSLSITIGVLAAGVIFSLVKTKNDDKKEIPPHSH